MAVIGSSAVVSVTTISTDLDLAGGTLDNKPGTGFGDVLLDAMISNGTILLDGGSFAFTVSATLNAMAWLGTLALDGGEIEVIGGLAVRSSAGATSGTIDLSVDGSSITYGDSETLDHLTLILGGADANSYFAEGDSGQTLTLGATTLLSQTTGTARLEANGGSDTLVNQGQMVLAGGTLLE